MDILNPFEPESGEMPHFSESSRSNSTHSNHHTTSAHHGSSGYSDEMVFVGHVHDDDDDPALWIYKINTLHQWVEVVATLFMVLTVAIMFNQIGLHLAHNQHPGFRNYTVRILLMVPIYSVTSYLGLHNPSNALIYAMVRDCYECVVLFSFLQYCLTYLGGPENIARYMLAKQHDEAVQIVTEADRIQKRRASEVAELGFASHLTPQDLYENGDEDGEDDNAGVDDDDSSKSSARKLIPEKKTSAKPQVRSASPASSSSSARSGLIGEALSSASAGFFSDAGKGVDDDDGTVIDGDSATTAAGGGGAGGAGSKKPTSTWQQRSMKFLGCGHKAKKKIQSHVHHGRFCFALCPCCPVWRPRTCELRRPWALGAEFLRLAILGTLQYIPWSLFVTVLGLWGHHHGYYHEGRFSLNDLYLYCVIIKNWSQCWALYCLGLFYLVMHDELAAIRPVFKFSMIKVVVILMWDQQVLVAYLEKSTTMKEADDGLIKRGWTSTEVGFCIQNFLCLLEMFFIGIGMAYAFHYTEWASPEVYETDHKVGPLCAFWRGKAINTTKDLVHDLTSLTHGTVAATKYVVSPATWQKFGKGLSTSGRGKSASAAAGGAEGDNSSGADANGFKKAFTTAKGGYARVASGAAEEDPDPEAPLSPPTPSKRRNTFVMLPRLMTSEDFKVSARFVQSVSFMDVLHATREINVLEKQLNAEKEVSPESLFHDEAQKRFGVGTAAAQTVKDFLATQGVYHEDDLLEAGNHNLPQLLRDASAATGSTHRHLTPPQVKKLERWVHDLNQRQSSSVSENSKR